MNFIIFLFVTLKLFSLSFRAPPPIKSRRRHWLLNVDPIRVSALFVFCILAYFAHIVGLYNVRFVTAVVKKYLS